MLDLIISGGTCVLPSGTVAADIGVTGRQDRHDRRAGHPGRGRRARSTPPARLVIPGGIDPHIHCSMPVRAPGRPDVLTDPPSQVSHAALHGGTTTLIDFVQCVHDRTIQESIEQTRGALEGRVLLRLRLPSHADGRGADAAFRPARRCDAGRPCQHQDLHHRHPAGKPRPHGAARPHLGGAQGRRGGGRHRRIHAEDNDIVMFMYEKLMRENRVGFEHMAEVHNALSEELSFNRVIRLAENVEGAALYMVHVSAATGVAALEASRAKGFPMYGETLHQYLMYNAEDYKRPGGQMYPHLPVAQISRGPEAAVERHQSRRHPGDRDRRAVLSAAHQAAGQPHRRHDRRQLRRRAAGRPDVHADGDASAATRRSISST